MDRTLKLIVVLTCLEGLFSFGLLAAVVCRQLSKNQSTSAPDFIVHLCLLCFYIASLHSVPVALFSNNNRFMIPHVVFQVVAMVYCIAVAVAILARLEEFLPSTFEDIDGKEARKVWFVPFAILAAFELMSLLIFWRVLCRPPAARPAVSPETGSPVAVVGYHVRRDSDPPPRQTTSTKILTCWDDLSNSADLS